MERKSIVNPCIPYNYSRTYSALKRLVCRYAGLVRFADTGTSQKKRNIPSVVLGRGNKKILAIASVHGREYVTTGYLLKCVEEYAESYVRSDKIEDFDIREIFWEYSFYVVPMANPDSVEIALGRDEPYVKAEDFCAYEYKDNARGVNLNANFPFEWEKVPPSRHRGRSAASERETRFLMSMCRKHDFESALSFHSRGGCVFWRDSGNGEVKGDCTAAQKIALRCGLHLCPVTEKAEAYSGGFENWFRSTYKKPALCIELVGDEKAPFDKCCTEFYEYTDFERTKTALLCAI